MGDTEEAEPPPLEVTIEDSLLAFGFLGASSSDAPPVGVLFPGSEGMVGIIAGMCWGDDGGEVASSVD